MVWRETKMMLREKKMVQREKKMILMLMVHLRAYKWMPAEPN
jgi:hypothetical protein